MIWITVEDMIQIHSVVIRKSGGLDGLRDRASLESAVAAPLQTFAGEEIYPSVLEKIARLGYGLTKNHSFVDGNKRIGAMAVQLLLKWNGYSMSLKKGELADMFLALAAGDATDQDLYQWICNHLE